MKLRGYLKVGLLIVVILIIITGASSNYVSNEYNQEDFTKTIRKGSQTSTEGRFITSDDPDWPFDIFISAGGYQSYSAERSQDTAMYGSFTSTMGTDFFLCDQENYDLWTSHQTAIVYELSNNIGSKDWTFIAPYTDTWFLFYDNTDNLFTQAHVVGTHRLDITPPTVSWNLVNGQTYSGTIDITITASDEGFGVNDIQLYVDGALVDYTFADTLTYSWETNGISDGEYTVRVDVNDNANHLETLEVDVNVSNILTVLIPAIAIGGGSLVLIGVAFVLYRKMKPSEQVYTSPESVVRRVPPKPVGFCPSCGTARQPPDAGFCSRCGAAFPE